MDQSVVARILRDLGYWWKGTLLAHNVVYCMIVTLASCNIERFVPLYVTVHSQVASRTTNANLPGSGEKMPVSSVGAIKTVSPATLRSNHVSLTLTTTHASIIIFTNSSDR